MKNIIDIYGHAIVIYFKQPKYKNKRIICNLAVTSNVRKPSLFIGYRYDSIEIYCQDKNSVIAITYLDVYDNPIPFICTNYNGDLNERNNNDLFNRILFRISSLMKRILKHNEN